jgi:hypothetical protein
MRFLSLSVPQATETIRKRKICKNLELEKKKYKKIYINCQLLEAMKLISFPLAQSRNFSLGRAKNIQISKYLFIKIKLAS